MFHPPLTPFSYPCRAQAGSARAAAGAKPFRTSLHSFLALPRMRAQRQAAAGRATIDSTPLPSTFVYLHLLRCFQYKYLFLLLLYL